MLRISRWSCLVLLAACQGTPTEQVLPVPYRIGGQSRPVRAVSPEAQLWFDRGLMLAYGFNHEEAIRCFERAADADPGCAMAYWGKAYALGPNYNATVMTDEQNRGVLQALQVARTLRRDPGSAEWALIEALSVRYSWPALEDRAPLDRAYAKAMREIHRAHPDDPDVACLTAEALMQLRPWKLWTPEGTPAPEQPEIRKVLEGALARWPDHPGLCHLYIHAMEAGPEAAAALPAAQRLEDLAPGLGHLVHMPSHIYTWTGRYEDVVRVNLRAVDVDDAYVRQEGRMNFYSGYRMHNLHFVAYGAMWEGRQALAMEYARRQVSEVPPELVAAYPDSFDIYAATPYHVMVRFGRWEDMLREPDPGSDLPAARAVWHYARGVALASLGRVDEALAEQARFRSARTAVPPTRLLFNNPVSEVLGVAEKVLAGEIAYRQAQYDAAFAALRDAVALDDRLHYDEPWGWMEPVRHALGALLTEQGRYGEAEAVYRRDLQKYPNNGWSLHGLEECLRAQGRVREADETQRRFEEAWARADVEIPGSCFCKTR